jgi:UDP-N-acetylglucosamine diphosphorylase/glucosamine-1-phosphate N-acetyltransferase
MSILLFDGPERNHLLPFTYLRPVAQLRIGIDRLQDKWEAALHSDCSVYTQGYLQAKYPPVFSETNTFVNASFVPNAALVDAIHALETGQQLVKSDAVIAYKTSEQHPADITAYPKIEFEGEVVHLKGVADLFLHNAAVLKQDFERITQQRKSTPISSTNRVIAPENVFLEEGAKVECAILNASEGPIYIGKNAEVMEGSMLRGSIALCENAVVKMGAKIYGGTTIGPFGKVGGELSNVVLFGYSNKGHDGFLGNAVIGEWCNIGAATDASNLKNNYGKLRLWNYEQERFAKTDLQFCGLMMGDFSRCSIHFTFNTATVVGICANLFGSGFPRTFLPSFSYGGAQGLKTHAFDKALEANAAMMERRGQLLTEIDTAILAEVFEQSAQWRKD